MTFQEQNQFLTQRRWRVLAACCITNLCLGAPYAWSVFAGPLAEHLNALHGTAMTASDLALAFSFCNSLTFITMIAGGYLEKKIGARRIIFAGRGIAAPALSPFRIRTDSSEDNPSDRVTG